MPDPIPVMVLARLAVDSAYQKQGLGGALLKDALLRTIAAAQIAGIRAVLLHAMSDDAKRFYARAGFHECPIDPMMMMMMITLAEVENNLGPPARADDLGVGTDLRRRFLDPYGIRQGSSYALLVHPADRLPHVVWVIDDDDQFDEH